MRDEWVDIPGADLIEQGLADLRAGLLTEPALLVAIGRPRLAWLGVELPTSAFEVEQPEHRLYLRLCELGRRDAHAAYNALIARLVSFERELERREFRRRRVES